MALAEAPAHLEALYNWSSQMDPEANDYVTTFSVGGAPVSRSILRSGNGITELKLEAAATSGEEGKEPEFAEVGLFQYSENGLAVQFNGQTYLVDVDSILAYALRSQDFSVEALKNDYALVKSLAVNAALTLLQPEVTVNPDNGSLLFRIAVTEKELAERMPAFLESLSGNEAAVDALLMKYSNYICAAIPNFPLSVAGLKEAWQVRAENPDWVMPSITLEAEGAAMLASETSKMQFGITGNLAIMNDQANFSLEYLPGQDKCFVLSGCVNGTCNGEAFDNDIFMQKKPTQLEATVSINGKTQEIVSVDATMVENYLSITLSDDKDGKKDSVFLTGSFDDSTKDLVGYLSYSSSDAAKPEADPEYKDLLYLTATVQEQGIMGTLFIEDSANIRFTLTNGKLYYRGQFLYTDASASADVDAWIFPQGGKTFRYRVETKVGAKGQPNVDKYLISGALDPNHLDVNVAPVLGESIFKMDVTRTIEENGQSVTGTLETSIWGQTVSAKGDLKVDTAKFPTFFDGEIRVAGTGLMPEGIYTMSYVPGKLTVMDNANFYELTRSEDTAEKLAYVLTRNRISVLGSGFSALENGSYIASVTIGEKETTDCVITIEAVPYTPVVRETPEAPVVIGQFEGTYDENGNVVGTVIQPIVEKTVVEEPAPEQKITPINTANAVKINANTIIKWMMGESPESILSQVESGAEALPEELPLP